jgi:UDP-N-acetylglucosamine 2-epimerase (non-hydrolysing)
MAISLSRKIDIVLGTRPEIIKLSPVIEVLKDHFELKIIHTGQHFSFQMDAIFFQELGLPSPDFKLEVGSGSHGLQTGKMLQGLERIFEEEKPDLVIVQGDTNSTLAGALAAAKLHISVAHVEAGCRSFNRSMPEEINRIVADHISDLLFAPDQKAYSHLRKEGIPPERILLSGSTGVEACLIHREKARKLSYPQKLGLVPNEYLLATVHRAETADDPVRLSSILSALDVLAQEMPLLLPLHPRTRKRMEEGGLPFPKSIRFLPPLGYLEFLALLDSARAVFTDSGGVQEEAATLGVPLLILREETEWMEYVERGQARLLGWRKEEILERSRKILNSPSSLRRMKEAVRLPQDSPSAKILEAILSFLSKPSIMGSI